MGLSRSIFLGFVLEKEALGGDTPLLLFCTLQISPLSSSGGDTSLGGREGGRGGPAFLAPRDGKGGGGPPPPELLRRGGAKRGEAEAGDRTLLVYRKLRDMGK